MKTIARLHSRWSKSEQGQSLVFIALLIVGLVGMLALSIDGGMSYAQRRAAQNAADAGALAGANILCNGGSAATAITKANEYAVDKNKADEAVSVVNGKEITVTAGITFPTFFAGVLGRPEMSVSAVASAGCHIPCGGVGMLPVAFFCQPTIGLPDSDSSKCAIQYGTGMDDPPKSIIMNSLSNTEDYVCKYIGTDSTKAGKCWAEDGTTEITKNCLDCDFDDDGIIDRLSGGNRSWLDLNGGGGGASELDGWIKNGYNDLSKPLKENLWLAGESGTAVSVFKSVSSRVGDIVVLPMFDKMCIGDPKTSAGCTYDWTNDDVYYGGGTYQTYYHIKYFAAFKITCVESPKPEGIPPVPPGENCPVKAKLMEDNPDFKANTETIEGYFVENYVPGMVGACGQGDGTGVFTIYLNR